MVHNMVTNNPVAQYAWELVHAFRMQHFLSEPQATIDVGDIDTLLDQIAAAIAAGRPPSQGASDRSRLAALLPSRTQPPRPAKKR